MICGDQVTEKYVKLEKKNCCSYKIFIKVFPIDLPDPNLSPLP